MRNKRFAGDVYKQLQRTALAAEKANKEALLASAKVFIRSIDSEAAKAVGADLQLSNLGKLGGKRTKLRVRYIVNAAQNSIRLSAEGPWGIPETGAVAHEMIPKLGRVRGKGAAHMRRQRDLNIAFGARGALSGVKPMGNKLKGFGPVYRIQHPGSKGKQPFHKATVIALPKAKSEFTLHVVKEIGRAFIGQ